MPGRRCCGTAIATAGVPHACIGVLITDTAVREAPPVSKPVVSAMAVSLKDAPVPAFQTFAEHAVNFLTPRSGTDEDAAQRLFIDAVCGAVGSRLVCCVK